MVFQGAKTILAILILCANVSAWGPATDRFICHESVKFVWGVDAIAQCIPLQDQESLNAICYASSAVLGRDFQPKCLKAVANNTNVDPSTMSADIFQDSENHYDFSHCPLTSGGNTWVCGDPLDRPAYDVAQKWFKQAESATDLCTRIYYFCIGASYFSDSESTLHQVRMVSNNCVNNIEESIDRSIQNGLTDWSASQECKFDNGLRGQSHAGMSQRMGESSSTVNKIIADLVPIGSSLKDLPYKPGSGVIVLANSIDSAQAGGFMDYLRSKGIKLAFANASEFDTLKYNKRVIILGGQNSPEGVGAVADTILTGEKESALLSQGYSLMAVKEGVWSVDQKVILLAGNEVQDTVKACQDNRESVLAQLKG